MRALKALGAAAAAAGLIFAGTVAPASAAGGCPTGDGWTLAPVGIAIDALDNGNYADQNGDGLACFKVNKGQTAKNGPDSFTWKDNTNPV